jgi:hypothetical protein
MISTIASAYAAAAEHGPAEPYLAWRLCWERLREDWQNGERPGPQDLWNYLADVPIADRQAAACDLIAEHLRLAWAEGSGSTLEEYASDLGKQVPCLTDTRSMPADLVEDEFVARSTPPLGDQPLLTDYGVRFPDRDDISRRLAGRCLAQNRYVKLRVVGTGLVGVVHQAYDRTEHRLVAIKEAPSSSTAGSFSRQILYEAKITAELSHPGAVAFYDVGQSVDGAYCVMEFLAGRTLGEHIHEYHAELSARPAGDNRRRLHDLVAQAAQMCDAIAHAHEQGIVHRDIKPGNVIVSAAGTATIIDWGLASRLNTTGGSSAELAGRSAIVGTPQYMAPEQVEQQEVAASDVFSLGAVLYEILTGRPPYNWEAGALPSDWRETVRRARFPSPRQVAAGTPRRLDEICRKALARAPSDRHATARELGKDLSQYAQDRPPGRGWRWWF